MHGEPCLRLNVLGEVLAQIVLKRELVRVQFLEFGFRPSNLILINFRPLGFIRFARKPTLQDAGEALLRVRIGD